MNILITGSGGNGGISVCRALRLAPEKLNLIGIDCDRWNMKLSETDTTDRIFRADHPNYDYANELTSFIMEYSIDLVIPTTPQEVRAISNMDIKQKFLPSYETVKICQDKYQTYLKLKQAGLPVPQTWAMWEDEKPDKYPVWVRGCGVPGYKMSGHALLCYNLPYMNFWIDYCDGFTEGKQATSCEEMIASEYLPGRNLTWMSLWREGDLITSQGRERDLYKPEWGAPLRSHTIHDERLNDIGPKAIRSVDSNPHGVYFIDFKEDKEGNPKITEINAGRFGSTAAEYYAEAGLNLPDIMIRTSLGEEIDVPAYNPLPKNIYFLRGLNAKSKIIRL